MTDETIRSIKFDERGLVPAIVQEAVSGQVLMMAWMNAESLGLSLETGYTHFWSRSRGKLWKKGESSGHVQRIRGMLYDCDADAILVTVDQTGPACHTGTVSCFTNPLGPAVPGETREATVLRDVEKVIDGRRAAPRAGSYVSRLFEVGGDLIRSKVAEEAGETVEASATADAAQVVYESADLLFHLLVLLRFHDRSLADVERELARRFGNAPKADHGPRRGEKPGPPGAGEGSV